MAVTTRGTRKKQEKKEELLSLNNPKKPTYKPGDAFKSTSNASRTAALKDKLEPRKPASERKPVYRIGDKYSPNAKSKDNEISQAEMDDIDRQIKKIQKDKNKVTEKDIEKVSGKKVVTRNGKKGFLFGKGAKFRPFGGVLARALLGDDEKFGGDKGLIDFIRKKEKPVKKNQGGMMKKKGYARGGAIGMKSKMASKGGAKKFPDLTGDGKITRADILKGRGVKQKPPGMRNGGMAMRSKMASKGGKMGGKVPPGYKKGGSVGRKKARGVGAAKRGFGKAMR